MSKQIDYLIQRLREESCEEYGQTLLMREAADSLEDLRKENCTLRNELCLKCGRYREAHNGSCDGCRWKEI